MRRCSLLNWRPTRRTRLEFTESLDKITRSEPGDISDFVEVLQDKVDEKLDNQNPPDTEVISAPF
jgi:hypothetical protein